MANKRNRNESRKTAQAARLSRRSLMAGAAAATGLAAAWKGPFIGNAEAATPTLRLLMWQPYAIKETVASFEGSFKARFSPTFFDGNSEAFNKMKVGGTKDFDIVQGDGFWPRLYFRQGLTQAVDYGKIPNMRSSIAAVQRDSSSVMAPRRAAPAQFEMPHTSGWSQATRHHSLSPCGTLRATTS